MTRLPRVLQVYNEYRRYGGEDAVVRLEAEMLARHGHEVELLRASTTELDGAGILRLAAAGFGAVWSFRGYAAMKKAIARFSPDIVHVHNEFPLLSPSIFWACHRADVPVVQTMHNYRLACANAHLLRGDRPCEDCVGRFPWPALRHRCYGPSLPRTAAVAARNVVHRWLGTYRKHVDAFIVLTEFSKDLLVRAGLPEERVFVKPNFQIAALTAGPAALAEICLCGRHLPFQGPAFAHRSLEKNCARRPPTAHPRRRAGTRPARTALRGKFRHRLVRRAAAREGH